MYNLGTGRGHSVREVIDTVAGVTGRPVPVQLGVRRAGDPAMLVAAVERARRVLGWRAERSSLDRIVADAVRLHDKRATRVTTPSHLAA